MKLTKLILVLGMVLGLADNVRSQEGCDGPVLKPGSSGNSCGGCSLGVCTGYTSVRNDYTHCGGMGYTYCSQSDQTVGQSHMPCTKTFDSVAWAIDQALYQECISRQGSGCFPPSLCDYTTCSAGTTGGSPIIFPVLDDLGDTVDCGYASIAPRPSSSLVELALLSLANYGS
jgi:hypothetical protein